MAARPVAIQKSKEPTDPPARIVSGAEAVAALRELETLQRNRDLWPYNWIYPPPDGERVHVEGVIVAPAAGVQTVVAQYTVDNGFNFVFTHVIQLFTQSWDIGSGDITWVLDINQPLGGGVVQGYPVQGFTSSNVPKGALQGGVFAPYPLPKPEILSPTDTLRSKVTTTASIVAGAPNRFISIFLGWKVPSAQ